jgi:serine/threonine protein kinase
VPSVEPREEEPGPRQPSWALAFELVGRALNDGWTVVERLTRKPAGTGGCFSVTYIATRGDDRAFVKVLDYSSAFDTGDPAAELHSLTEAFIFERQLLEACKSGKLARIVQPLGHGVVRDSAYGLPAQYILFELADGDMRDVLERMAGLDLVWALAALHNVAAALDQLHKLYIAHQDVKPSNVLSFAGFGMKLGDLGRASRHGERAPFDDSPIAGQWSYAPPELLYGTVSSDWGERRLATDLYLFGSLIVFVLTRHSMTSLLLSAMPEQFHPRRTVGMAYADLLPVLRNVFSDVVAAVQDQLPGTIGSELANMIRQLCDPDPMKRGHPRDRASGSPYALHRYVTRLDYLRRSLELGLV